MRGVAVLQLACLLAILSLATGVRAADCSEPVMVPDKPDLSQFADYNTFLVEIMKYKAARRERASHRQACPETYVKKERPSRNPTVIEKPETLTEALQRAQKIPRLDYSRHRTWHDKTTSRSFPLPDMDGSQLASNRVRLNLRMMSPDASPREGAEWLPRIFNNSLNSARVSGQEPEYRDWLFFQEWLPEQERRAEGAADSGDFGDRLAFISPVTSARGSSMTLYIGKDGNPLKALGTAYFTTCLSSCIED